MPPEVTLAEPRTVQLMQPAGLAQAICAGGLGGAGEA